MGIADDADGRDGAGDDSAGEDGAALGAGATAMVADGVRPVKGATISRHCSGDSSRIENTAATSSNSASMRLLRRLRGGVLPRRD